MKAASLRQEQIIGLPIYMQAFVGDVICKMQL